MPACFKLISRFDGHAETMQNVDRRICEHLGQPVHPTRWCVNWYNTVGLLLAMGKTWDDMREIYDPNSVAQIVIDFLEIDYRTDSWHEMR